MASQKGMREKIFTIAQKLGSFVPKWEGWYSLLFSPTQTYSEFFKLKHTRSFTDLVCFAWKKTKLTVLKEDFCIRTISRVYVQDSSLWPNFEHSVIHLCDQIVKLVCNTSIFMWLIFSNILSQILPINEETVEKIMILSCFLESPKAWELDQFS